MLKKTQMVINVNQASMHRFCEFNKYGNNVELQLRLGKLANLAKQAFNVTMQYTCNMQMNWKDNEIIYIHGNLLNICFSLQRGSMQYTLSNCQWCQHDWQEAVSKFTTVGM